MSKVEIVGPRTLLEDVLSLLREAAIFQIEPVVHGYIEEEYQKDIRSYMHDEETLSEVLFLEDLRPKIEEMLLYLPDVAVRMSYIEPMPIIDTIGKTIGKHLDAAKEMHKKREGLRKEVSELKRHAVFLTTLSALIENAKETPDLDFIGLTIREPAVVGRLSEVLSRLTDWKFELTTEAADDGTLIGLITIEKALSEKVKRTLSDERIPELSFPRERTAAFAFSSSRRVTTEPSTTASGSPSCRSSARSPTRRATASRRSASSADCGSCASTPPPATTT